MSDCDIIIPVWNQPAVTRDCLESIKKNTSAPFRIIIIDNASDIEMQGYLKNIKDLPVTLIRNEKNLGFVKAVNQGIAISKAPYLCVLNNDTLVTKDWLAIMLDVIKSQGSNIGIVNPSSNNLGQRPHQGEPIELYAERLKGGIGEFVELGAAVGFCMLIKKEVIDRIGALDEIYGMGNFEDTDFSRRAIREGYRCVRSCGAYVYHRENTSFNKIKTFEDDFKRNKEIYEFRWGRPKRIAYILDQYDDNTLMRLNAESLKLARLGNWVWYFYRDSIDVPRHSNIQSTRLKDGWFYPKTLFTILKKKKKFNEIFVGNERLAGVLNNLKFIHNAEIKYY